VNPIELPNASEGFSDREISYIFATCDIQSGN